MDMETSFQDRCFSRIQKIEEKIDAFLPENPGEGWMNLTFPGLGTAAEGRAPLEPASSLIEPGRDIVGRGGKRWRPLLMTLICEALGGGDAALPLVPLVELPHNASLIHDDIEDNSDERRGRPAVHLIYGTDTAINGGCFLYFLPLACVDEWEAPAGLKGRVYAAWGEHMRRLHLGQAMDIAWHRDFASRPSPEEYTLMCRLKTGALARLAAVLGVYAGLEGSSAPALNPPEGEAPLLAAALGEAAEKLGVGFQILDDVKNLTTGIPGKKRGDDIVEGKKSLPVLLYMDRRPEAGALAARCFAAARSGGTGVPEVEEFIDALGAAGVLEDAEKQGRRLIAEAGAVFSGLPGTFPAKGNAAEARSLLAGFTDLII
jgi:octaprenyl-diphosphate synthase